MDMYSLAKGAILLLGLLSLLACTANPTTPSAEIDPILMATLQADQYWRDAQATTQSLELTSQANYQRIQATSQSATQSAYTAALQATSTAQAQQTKEHLAMAFTVDAATVQAQETALVRTVQAQETATRLAEEQEIATATAVAGATTAAISATKQAIELAQLQAQARRENLMSFFMFGLVLLTLFMVLGLGVLFIWKALPLLISRLGVFRYGQHGNPLFLTTRNGHTVLTDPLRMLQPTLTIHEDGQVQAAEVAPHQLQAWITNGVLQTLIEQLRYPPSQPSLETPSLPTQPPKRLPPATITPKQLPATIQPVVEPSLPKTVSWREISKYSGQGIVLGKGSENLIYLDLARTPHILLSGSSGAGKTRRALRPLVAQALGQGYIVAILNESGADFHPFYDHPNAVLIRGNAPEYMAFIESALGEIQRREAILRAARVSEWSRLPAHLQTEPPILIVIDEILALATLMSPAEQKQFWGLFASYASKARKLSMASVGAMTDPTYRVLGAGMNWREQCMARISFWVTKANISRAVLDEGGAEKLGEGQFLAMLGSGELVKGVAPHPSDDDLLIYHLEHYQSPLPIPEWMQQPVVTRVQPVTTSPQPLTTTLQPPQPPQPVVVQNGHQPAKNGTQPVVQPSTPFPTDRPPNPAEQEHIRHLHEDGLSKNRICKQVYGFKDGRVYGWVSQALNGHGKEGTVTNTN